ncbi:hypothetical protein [Asticcacaulis sp. AND118]|uniref:hypothetical protein n=1 Tax=Asticcacaulis sp. AND118 TaxID=2840468 RepID=UPI001CFFCAF7|nr:hypothetical protein [Asticcacaulis sp. AND118]UDF03995.1 hypothetical protein LH365_02835 [Asticcacaulis sp. AND118]
MLGTALALMLTATGAAAETVSLDTLTKRQFISTANARCQWFDGPTTLALKAGLLQNRNAALNHGVAPATVYGALDRARTAAWRAECNNPALVKEVETMRGAYRGFVAQNRLSLPGLRSEWLADRTEQNLSKWRLVQYQQTGNVSMAFGLYGTLKGQNLSVMAQFNGEQPYAARLIVRDPKTRATGFINREALAVSAQMPKGLSRYDLSFAASNRRETQIALKNTPRVNLAGFTVDGKFAGHAEKRDTLRFDFPMNATVAIGKLDPREDVVVAFEFNNGTQYARFEAGDFVPGLVFATLPSPYGQ